MKNLLEEEIMGALARGYTYPENSHKVLDDKLIMAMVKEVMKVIDDMRAGNLGK